MSSAVQSPWFRCRRRSSRIYLPTCRGWPPEPCADSSASDPRLSVGDNHEMRPRPLFHIRHLPRQKRLKFFFRHTRAAPAPRRAAPRTGLLTTTRASMSSSAPVSSSSGISSTTIGARSACSGQITRARSCRYHQRMDQSFQLAPALLDGPPAVCARAARSTAPSFTACRESGGDFFAQQRPLGVKAMNGRVGIMHRHVFGRE